jgi:hypothetical protein
MRMQRLFKGLWRYHHGNRPSVGTISDVPTPDTAADKMENRLLTILAQVNEWLQFAEAKNAGLVALDVIALTAIVSILPSTEVEITAPVAGGLLAAGLLLVLSLAISLWSFIPRSDRRTLVPAAGRPPRATDNLYFYGDVGLYQPRQLATEIARRYDGIPHYDPVLHPSHVDLAGQIIANARITVAKNGNFRVATIVALLAFAAAVAGVLVELMSLI